MNRALKTFLLWLLIAALPLQGFAAVVQASCGAMAHHGSAELAVPAPAPAHQHEHDAGAGHHEDASSDSATARSATPVDDASGTKHGSSFCSAGASCCIGAVAPPSVPMASHARGDALPGVSSPSALLTGFIPAGLERPPKRITA